MQVRDTFIDRILTGQWKSGGVIPSELELARELAVSAGTVRKALDMLEAQHVLARKQGRGTFVNDQSTAALAKRFDNILSAAGELMSERVVVQGMRTAPTDDETRHRLQLHQGALVSRFRRLHFHEEQAFMVEDVWVPAGLFPDLHTEPEAAESIVNLAQRHGRIAARATERASVRLAEKGDGAVMGVAIGTPLLILDRVVFGIDEVALEWRLGSCRLNEAYYFAAIR
jgi:GntR family transcriptional regulator